MEKWQSNLPFFFYICYNIYGENMRKLGLLLLLPLLLTACGTSPKEEVTKALEQLELVDNYQMTMTYTEKVRVLTHTESRTVEFENQNDVTRQKQIVKTTITEGEQTTEETTYHDLKEQVMYTQDSITNQWYQEPEENNSILDTTILTGESAKVEEVESEESSLLKYRISLSTEDMKRLFFREKNEKYISMLIHQPGEVFVYVNYQGYITKIEINLTDIIDMQDPDSSCEEAKLVFTFENYNNLDPIEIPLYVTETAITR